MVTHNADNAQKLGIIDAQLNILRRREAEVQRIIGEMQSMQASILQERQDLESQREELEHLSVPFHWVPAEILIQIFSMVIMSEFEEQRLRGKQSSLWAPFTLSHVCRSWHKVTTSTPDMWSFLSLHGTLRQHPALQEHLRRSQTSPLHVLYRVPPDIPREDDLQQMKDVTAELEEHFCRIRTFDFQSRTVRAMDFCLESLKKFVFATTTPTVESLSLVVINESSSNFGVVSSYANGKSGPPRAFENLCRVKFLKTGHLIPYCLPPQMFADLTHLELSFAQRKSPLGVPLPISALRRFLYHTPRLEVLVIFDTTPIFDVTTSEPKVPLLHLRALDWSNPQVKDVTKLMSLLYTPSLAKFDLWLGRPQQPIFFSSPPSLMTHQSSYAPCVLEYPRLKELNIQCMGNSDSVKYVFGKFLFPALEKVEIANFAASSKADADEEAYPPSLPALTDIFRDPRLSNLTHLTLCSWSIPSDIGFVRAFLGYLPTLTSLTLEKCLNVGTLIHSLQELVLVQFISKMAPQQRRDVKVCPKLEALTLWGCSDVEFACLRELVSARNRNAESMHSAVPNLDTGLALSGARPILKLGQVQGNGKGETMSTTKGRVILPLRKTRHQGQSPTTSGHSGSTQGVVALPNAIPGIDVTRSFSQHTHILYLRIEDCKLINQVEAESLKSLGVLDVIWS